MNFSSGSRKEIFLCSVFLFFHLLAFWMWYRVIPIIIEGDGGRYRAFIWPVLALIVAAALFSLTALLVRHRILARCTAILGGLLPFLLFGFPATGIAWAILVAVLVLLSYADSSIRTEMASSLRYRMPKFIKPGLGLYFTAAALVFSLFYLNRIDEREVFSILFPQPLFDFTLRAFSGTIQHATGLPPLRPEQTVNEVMVELLRAQLQSQGISWDRIPKQELAHMLAAQREEFAKTYGIHLGGGEKIGTVLATTVTGKIKEIVGAYSHYLPLAAALAFFFAIKAVSIVFRYLSVCLAIVLMKLLVLAKVVRKEKEQIEVERFVF